MKAKVLTAHGGVCALAAGKATSEKVIANIRNKAIAIAVLFLDIFLYSPLIFTLTFEDIAIKIALGQRVVTTFITQDRNSNNRKTVFKVE
jgi:hypothetical protein